MNSAVMSLQITVTGRVQNVGFRSWILDIAKGMGLYGFVKNNQDGSVYIEVEGSEHLVRLFEANCTNGPNWTRVDNVIVCLQPICGFIDFIIRR